MTLDHKSRNNNVETMRQLKEKSYERWFIKELKRRQFYEKETVKETTQIERINERVNKLRRLQERLDDN